MNKNTAKIIPLKIDKIRAIKQASAVFKGLHTIIWEYVINGLAYQLKGTGDPQVEVKIDTINNSIEISDNGRGMDSEDLQNFFTAYAPNKDRIEGNYVAFQRGYYGTGGLSIFQIAKTLKIISVKNNKLYEGTLTSDDINKDEGFKLSKNGIKTDTPNGSKFVATDLKRPINNSNIKDTKEYIQKQMMSLKGAQVFINDDLCEYKEPAIEENLTRKIYSKDTPFFENLKKYGFGAGEIELIIKKTKKPLPKGEYGISVLGDNNLLEVCSPGIDTRKYVNYIIGEANIKNIYSKLEKFDPPLADQSRKMELNTDNPYVSILRNFIAVELKKFEEDVSKIEKEREKKQFDQKLANKFDQISEKANDFLNDIWEKLNLDSINNQKMTKKIKKQAILKETIGNIIKPGDDFYLKNETETSDNDNKSNKKPPKDLKKNNNSKNLKDKVKKNNMGGLRIEQKAMGEEESRAIFLRDKSIIYINTDFPVIKKYVEKRDYENEVFITLIKEIASSELAIAITTALLQKGEYGTDTLTAMVDLKNKLDEFSKGFDSIK